MNMLYLTHYEEYPIYAPEEGSYYYPGNQAKEFYRLNSMKQAKRQLQKMRKELEADGYCVWDTGAYKPSRYIGKAESWVIEKVYGSENSGWHPYE
jgi:hypothetical protein